MNLQVVLVGGGNYNNETAGGSSTEGIGGYTNQTKVDVVGRVDETCSGGGGGQTVYSTTDRFSGEGGSGVVIVRIPSRQYKLTWSGTLIGNAKPGANGTIVGDDWYYRFTSGTANDVILVSS